MLFICGHSDIYLHHYSACVLGIVWSCDNFVDSTNPFDGCDMDLDVYHGEDHVDAVPDPLGVYDNDVLRVLYPEVRFR